MAKQRIDTQAIGLDTALALSRWLTGSEHLHYGLWTGLDVSAGNVGRAQDAYSARLFAHLPKGNLRILDIGGGAGETAKKLIALGHSVEIVVPSAYLAGRCRENAPQAVVHEATFQDAAPVGPFDLCLFSESFQYIPLDQSLPKALSLLGSKGEILIGDCFRSPAFPTRPAGRHICGGGHRISDFRAAVAGLPLTILAEEDITHAVAPSIDIEQGLFNVLGRGLLSTDAELAQKRPVKYWLLHRALSLLMSPYKRSRLAERLFQQQRNSALFIANNTYLLLRLIQK
jgi:SAM-dependent methyltransferase